MFEQNKLLYKVSPSTGKTQIWKGFTDGDKICVTFGQKDGKMQTKVTQAKAKNIGRANATTPEQQAVVELEAMYEAQVNNKHYYYSEIEAIEANENCLIPRKITNYKDRYDKMSETLLSSVKLNGSRACVINGKLYSKIGRHEEVKVAHLREAIELLGEDATFDAEVYGAGLSLQRIRSAWLKPVKTDKEIVKIAKDKAKKCKDTTKLVRVDDAINYLGYNPNEDAQLLKFNIFDIPTKETIPFTERVKLMEELSNKVRGTVISGSIDFLFPKETHSHTERMELLKTVCDLGLEGLVHYEPDGMYEFGKRSTNTAKSKPRYDAEAKVVKVTKDKNGEGLLHCIACDELDNVKFKCKMKVERRDGNRYERDYETMLNLVGKWITFSYEELSEAGIATKPVGEEERLCDDKGRPLE